MEVAGSVSVGDTSITDGSLSQFINLAAKLDVAQVIAGDELVSGSLDLLTGTTAVRFAAVRSVDEEQLVLLVTSAEGTDQAVPLSGTWIQSWPVGEAPTALRLTGNGRVEYLVAGD